MMMRRMKRKRKTERQTGREKEIEKERKRKRDREGERDPKTSCSCANDSEDHNRLPVPTSKQALSRRLQVQHPQKNRPNGKTLASVFQDGSNETRRKRVHVSWSVTSGARYGRLWRARTPGICE